MKSSNSCLDSGSNLGRGDGVYLRRLIYLDFRNINYISNKFDFVLDVLY